MAFGRGLLFGFLVGAIATATSRRSMGPMSEGTASSSGPPGPAREAMAAGRHAAHDERDRLQREFRDARRRGDLHPEDHPQDDD